MSNRPAYPGTPRWVYIFGVIVALLVVAFLVRHILSSGFRGHSM